MVPVAAVLSAIVPPPTVSERRLQMPPPLPREVLRSTVLPRMLVEPRAENMPPPIAMKFGLPPETRAPERLPSTWLPPVTEEEDADRLAERLVVRERVVADLAAAVDADAAHRAREVGDPPSHYRARVMIDLAAATHGQENGTPFDSGLDVWSGPSQVLFFPLTLLPQRPFRQASSTESTRVPFSRAIRKRDSVVTWL
jgi:hypothetical protein